jgi:hypothetical protein
VACNHCDLHGEYPRTFDHMELAPGTTNDGVRPAAKKPALPPPRTRSQSRAPSAAHRRTRTIMPQGKRTPATPRDPSKPPTSFLRSSSLSLPPQGRLEDPTSTHGSSTTSHLCHNCHVTPVPKKSKLFPTKFGISTATLGFTTTIRKHQDDILSLLCSFTGTAAISASKIEQLRADNIALMTSTTICMQQAGGTHFPLKHLYNIAHAEEKVARQLFAKEALMTITANTATTMSSITDADQFTTVSCRGVGSSSSPPKQRPQSCSPPCPGDDIEMINPFDDSFLTSFPPLGGHAPALPGETGNLSDLEQQRQLEELMVLASPCAALILGTGQDGHAKNTARENITKDLDDAKYLSLPSSLLAPLIFDQDVFDAHIGNPVLHKPTNCGGQAPLGTTALPTSTSTSLVFAPLGGTHIVGTRQDGHAKIAPQGGITNNLNSAQYSSLPLPPVPHVIGDQGDLDAHTSNLACTTRQRKLSAVTKPC